MGNRLKKDDLVQVVAGRDKGKQGRILKVLEEGRVLVEGVNVMKRHQSPKKFKEAGIIEKEAPIDASNVMIVDPQSNTPTRVRAGEKDGKKVRVAVKSGAVLD
ncbi:MAG: 50S ribosomal protein L24 [Myxococcota bacterium]|jgi:large subunit ribosomal protein L24|nr:50S ribosomal protein L24 [Myxococcota bacterium]